MSVNDPNLSCREERRREDVRAASLFGLDYVEVVDEQQLTLNVFFLGKAPQNIEKANVVLSGGRRIRDVQIKAVRVQRQPDPTLDGSAVRRGQLQFQGELPHRSGLQAAVHLPSAATQAA